MNTKKAYGELKMRLTGLLISTILTLSAGNAYADVNVEKESEKEIKLTREEVVNIDELKNEREKLETKLNRVISAHNNQTKALNDRLIEIDNYIKKAKEVGVE